MLWLIWRILRFVLLLPLRVFLLGCATALWSATSGQITTFQQTPMWWVVMPGILAGVVLAAVTYERFATAYIWVHELTHMIAGLPFLILPAGIRVNEEGGCYRGLSIGFFWPLGIDFCLLAPYFLPLLALPFAALYPEFGAAAGGILLFGVGLGAGIQLLAGPREVIQGWTTVGIIDAFGNPNRTDIARTGFLVSLIFIPFYAILTVGILLCVVNHGFLAVPDYLLDIYRNAALHDWELVKKLPFRLP